MQQNEVILTEAEGTSWAEFWSEFSRLDLINSTRAVSAAVCGDCIHVYIVPLGFKCTSCSEY